MRDGDIILLVIGGYALLNLKGGIDWGGGWAFPAPDLAEGTPAQVSQEFRKPTHMGVDIMYRQSKWFARQGTPVLAAKAGTVWSTEHTSRGWNVVLDHGAPFATFYQHLEERPMVKAGDPVVAGQQLGIMGADPTDPAHLRHLHFAVWYKGHGDAASVDPARAMLVWRRSVWAG